MNASSRPLGPARRSPPPCPSALVRRHHHSVPALIAPPAPPWAARAESFAAREALLMAPRHRRGLPVQKPNVASRSTKRRQKVTCLQTRELTNRERRRAWYSRGARATRAAIWQKALKEVEEDTHHRRPPPPPPRVQRGPMPRASGSCSAAMHCHPRPVHSLHAAMAQCRFPIQRGSDPQIYRQQPPPQVADLSQCTTPRPVLQPPPGLGMTPGTHRLRRTCPAGPRSHTHGDRHLSSPAGAHPQPVGGQLRPPPHQPPHHQPPCHRPPCHRPPPPRHQQWGQTWWQPSQLQSQQRQQQGGQLMRPVPPRNFCGRA